MYKFIDCQLPYKNNKAPIIFEYISFCGSNLISYLYGNYMNIPTNQGTFTNMIIAFNILYHTLFNQYMYED